MPKPRRKENRGLPARWRFYHGAFRYLVPPGDEHLFDGKKQFRLGATLPEAHKAFGERTIRKVTEVRTVGHMLDWYAAEVVPTYENPKTRTEKLRHIAKLRSVFADALVSIFKPSYVYGYITRRGKLTAAHREIEDLSHAFTKLVQRGDIDKHPFKDQVRLDGDLALKPRSHYVTDDEILSCLSLPAVRRRGSVRALQAYIRLKLLTGLRRSDMLRLRMVDCQEDGIHVTAHKTGKAVVFTWNDERRAAVEEAKAARPALSPFLFCNRDGEGYFDESTGTCNGFESIWSRFIDRVLKETKVTRRFTEHDLRRKAGSDAESLEKARALLQHADARTTQRIYRAKPERV